MDGTPLVFGLREHFSHSLQHTKTLVPNHQLYPVQATASEPLEEADPTGLVRFHTLSGAKNFTVSVLIYRNSHQNGYILILSAPVPPQIDPVHINQGGTLIAESAVKLEASKEYTFTYIQEGSAGIFYIDGEAALTVRLYGVSGKPIKLFAENNTVQLSSLRQYTD